MQRTIHMSYADATQVVYALRALADDPKGREWEVSPKSVRDVADRLFVSIQEAWLRDDGDAKLKITADDAGIAMTALVAKVSRSLKAAGEYDGHETGRVIDNAARIIRELGAKVNG